jgi:hypothetical protein
MSRGLHRVLFSRSWQRASLAAASLENAIRVFHFPTPLRLLSFQVCEAREDDRTVEPRA